MDPVSPEASKEVKRAVTGDTGFFLSLETTASLLFSPGNSRMLFLYLLPHPSITKSALFKNSIFR